jgi:hypothetical protein
MYEKRAEGNSLMSFMKNFYLFCYGWKRFVLSRFEVINPCRIAKQFFPLNIQSLFLLIENILEKAWGFLVNEGKSPNFRITIVLITSQLITHYTSLLADKTTGKLFQPFQLISWIEKENMP